MNNEEKDIKQEAVDYASTLMQSDDKSPEMVSAIAELLRVILN